MLGIILMIVGGGILGPCGIWSTISGFRDKNGRWTEVGDTRIGLGIVGILIALGLLILMPACQYSGNLALVYRLPAIERTIEEQIALVADGDIGSGLEGLQMKQKIQDLLLEKNELLATYEVRQVSPWWFFKPCWIELVCRANCGVPIEYTILERSLSGECLKVYGLTGGEQWVLASDYYMREVLSYDDEKRHHL